MEQPKLFDNKRAGDASERERLVLYALGEFQARGLALVGRELPLDRLRGALRRASEVLEVEELDDVPVAAAFESLGARVGRVPAFVAKHPFRITVGEELAARARTFYEEQAKTSRGDANSAKE
jgi:hypothetical protein